MNYKKVYDQIIDRANNRVLEGYIETHHIIPKCLGGTNDIENLVNLTAKEHFLCHLLLIKIYPNSHKLKYAAWAMCKQKKIGTRNYKVSARQYANLKEQLFQIPMPIETRLKISNALRGRKGKPHLKETKEKLSEYTKYQFANGMSIDTKNKISSTLASKYKSGELTPWNKDIPMSNEAKKKASSKLKGIPSIKKGIPLSIEQKEKMSIAIKLAWQKRKNKSYEENIILHK